MKSLSDYKLVFWDFDGVIKDSVTVKTDAFSKLFEKYGEKIQEKVVAHHLLNGGVSRRIKIEHYYKEFIGKELSETEINKQCDTFSNIVLQKVIDSAWVPGVESYLNNNSFQQIFVLVTGTPHDEIVHILEKLGISNCFESIWGSPSLKEDVINNILANYDLDKSLTVMVGDSNTDYDAAKKNDIDFILRNTEENHHLQKIKNIYCVDNFL